jgi:membrane-associated protease RseP (regulator of RpoE activity)
VGIWLNATISPSAFFEIVETVRAELEIKDAYVEGTSVTVFIFPSENLTQKIEKVRSELKPSGFDTVLQQSNGEIQLRILPQRSKQLRSNRSFRANYPLILFVVTIVSVAIAGYYTALGHLEVLRILGRIQLDDETGFLWGQTALYTLSVMCIIGLHELGHTIACRRNRVEASLPIFIPGIPGISPGTFGAVIMQKSPTMNRNQLFDIGLSGPLVGFAISLIVSYFGYSESLPVSYEEYNYITSQIGPSSVFYLPLIFSVLEPYLVSNSHAFTFFAHPLAYAGWIGTLITFLNAFPIGQLDGGHVARAVFGHRWHKILSYVGVIAMFLTGWWAMALLTILFLRSEHPGVLDEASPLSNSRKLLAILLIVIFVSCLTLSPDSPIGVLLR